MIDTQAASLRNIPLLYVLVGVLVFLALLMILTGDWWGVVILIAALAAVFADRLTQTRSRTA